MSAVAEPIIASVQTPLPAPAFRETVAEFMLTVASNKRAMMMDISWDDYRYLLDIRDAQRKGVRLTFDSGRLEIMSVSLRHEIWKKMIARLFEMLAMAVDMPILSTGNITISREDLEQGFEPDECYYTTDPDRISSFDKLNFQIDPVPDLAIEIEYSRNIIARLPLYAALGIREIWRFDRGQLVILVLNSNREYQTSAASMILPMIPLSLMQDLIRRSGEINETEWRREVLAKTEALVNPLRLLESGA